MRTTGHRSIDMLLRYVRQANAFSDNAALALGLHCCPKQDRVVMLFVESMGV